MSSIALVLGIFYIITITLASLSLLSLLVAGAPTSAAAKAISSNLNILSSDESSNMAISKRGILGVHKDSDFATKGVVTQSSESAVSQSGNDSHFSQRTVNMLPLPLGGGALSQIKDTTVLNSLLSSITNVNSASALSGNTSCIISVLKGGTPNITVNGNLIIGTNCDDIIRGDSGNDVIFTLAGNDEVYGGNGKSIIYAGSGGDKLYGEKGNDILDGGPGEDVLDGGPGNDIIGGGADGDLLLGGPGNDELYGGDSDDQLIGGPGADYFDCGNGADVIVDFNPQQGDTHADNCEVVLTHGSHDIGLNPSSTHAHL